MATLADHRHAKDALRALRVLAEDDEVALGGLRHPDQESQPYWQSADLQVIPNESLERVDAFGSHQMVIFTRHAAVLGWALFSFRDALRPYLTADNKCLVFGQLGLALRFAQAGAGPDTASNLLVAMLDVAEDILDAAEAARRAHRRQRGR